MYSLNSTRIPLFTTRLVSGWPQLSIVIVEVLNLYYFYFSQILNCLLLHYQYGHPPEWDDTEVMKLLEVFFKVAAIIYKFSSLDPAFEALIKEEIGGSYWLSI